MNKKSKNWKDLFSKNYILGSGIVLKIRDKNLSVGNAYKMMDEFLQAGLSRYEEHLAKKQGKVHEGWAIANKLTNRIISVNVGIPNESTTKDFEDCGYKTVPVTIVERRER